MNIAIITGSGASATRIVLTGGAPLRYEGGPSVLNNVTFNRDNQIETFQPLRSDFVKVFDRKNRKTQIEVQITRIHQTIADAHRFILTHDASIPNTGTVEFLILNDSGFVLEGRWMVAGINGVKLVSHTGITTVWNYPFVGGKLLTAKP